VRRRFASALLPAVAGVVVDVGAALDRLPHLDAAAAVAEMSEAAAGAADDGAAKYHEDGVIAVDDSGPSDTSSDCAESHGNFSGGDRRRGRLADLRHQAVTTLDMLLRAVGRYDPGGALAAADALLPLAAAVPPAGVDYPWAATDADAATAVASALLGLVTAVDVLGGAAMPLVAAASDAAVRCVASVDAPLTVRAAGASVVRGVVVKLGAFVPADVVVALADAAIAQADAAVGAPGGAATARDTSVADLLVDVADALPPKTLMTALGATTGGGGAVGPRGLTLAATAAAIAVSTAGRRDTRMVRVPAVTLALATLDARAEAAMAAAAAAAAAPVAAAARGAATVGDGDGPPATPALTADVVAAEVAASNLFTAVALRMPEAEFVTLHERLVTWRGHTAEEEGEDSSDSGSNKGDNDDSDGNERDNGDSDEQGGQGGGSDSDSDGNTRDNGDSDEQGGQGGGSDGDDDGSGSEEMEESGSDGEESGSDADSYGADDVGDDERAAAATLMLLRSAALARVDVTLLGTLRDLYAPSFAMTLDGTLDGLSVPPPPPPPAATPATAAGRSRKRGRDGGSSAASSAPPATRADHLRAAARDRYFAAAAGLTAWLALPAVASLTDATFRNILITLTGALGHKAVAPSAAPAEGTPPAVDSRSAATDALVALVRRTLVADVRGCVSSLGVPAAVGRSRLAAALHSTLALATGEGGAGAAVRRGAAYAAARVVTAAAEEALPLLPESMQALAEVVVDGDEGVETAGRAIVAVWERIVGEPIMPELLK